MSQGMKDLSLLVKTTFGEELASKIASNGRPLLEAIPRVTNWGGCYLLAEKDNGTRVLLEQRRDYERVQFRRGDRWAHVRSKCMEALIRLGSRMEGCLDGRPSAKPWNEDVVKRGPTWGLQPIRGWESERVALYSTWHAPHLCVDDGICVWIQDADALEVRFAYYGNTGPAKEIFEK